MSNDGTVKKHVGFNPIAWRKLEELCEHYGLGFSPMACVCIAEKHAEVFPQKPEGETKAVADKYYKSLKEEK